MGFTEHRAARRQNRMTAELVRAGEDVGVDGVARITGVLQDYSYHTSLFGEGMTTRVRESFLGLDPAEQQILKPLLRRAGKLGHEVVVRAIDNVELD